MVSFFEYLELRSHDLRHRFSTQKTQHAQTLNYSILVVGDPKPPQNSISHIDASLSRQPLVKGERLVRYEVNAVMPMLRYPRCYHIWNASRPLCGIAGGCAPLCCTLQDETSGCRIGSRDWSASLICAHPCGRGNDTTSDA